MAQNFSAISIKICIVFLATILVCTKAVHLQLKETKMSIFFHDIAAAPNVTFAMVAGIPGNKWDFRNFGTVIVSDDLIKEGIEFNSTEIGRGQGISVTSSLDGGNALTLISIVFTNKEYNGSTLEIQGRYIQLANESEVAVVSGTGKFRYASGYATFETVLVEQSIGYLVTRCNVSVLHY